MKKTKLFKSGNSQAIRIPKDFNLEEGDFYVTKVKDFLIILPKKSPWTSMLTSLDLFTEDFLEGFEKPATTKKRTA